MLLRNLTRSHVTTLTWMLSVGLLLRRQALPGTSGYTVALKSSHVGTSARGSGR